VAEMNMMNADTQMQDYDIKRLEMQVSGFTC
jgi:hypothetical protein